MPNRFTLLPGQPARRLAAGVATCLLLAACGGGGDSPPARETRAGLEPASGGKLTEQVRSLVRARHAARVAQPFAVLDRGLMLAEAVTGSAATLPVAATAAPASFSPTLVQEPGIDEADVLKTDGQVLYVQHRELQNFGLQATPMVKVVQAGAQGATLPLQTLALPQADSLPTLRGLLLAATAPRLLALTEHHQPVAMPQPCPPDMACAAVDSLVFAPTAVDTRVFAQLAERATDGRLTLGQRLELSGQFVASRRVGDVVYLVTTHTPRLEADQLPTSATEAELEAALAAITPAQVLPQLRVDGGQPQPLVNEADCLMQPGSSSRSLTVTTVLALDLNRAQPQRAAVCFLGGTEALYMAQQHFYLATTRSPEAVVLADGRRQFPAQFVTDVHKFAFSGLSLQYRASGEVAGHLGWDPQRMALRMGEHDGALRVLTFTGTQGWWGEQDATATGGPPPSPATLTVLRENLATQRLDTLATLPNASRPAALGKPGEQVYGVRFAGKRGYLVTFRTIDPLYVLDLSNPADPRAAGVLEVPGFSDTLLPLGDRWLLGVGREADAGGFTQGVKLALFDVADASQPRLKQAFTYGAQGSVTALDFSTHGLNLHWQGGVARLALPMALRNSPWGAEVQLRLHRWEVDTASGSVTEKPALAPALGGLPYELSGERSLQIGEAVFYLSQGELTGATW